jgi:Bacterial membrane protein YfhO
MSQRMVDRFPRLTAGSLYAAIVSAIFYRFWGGAFLTNENSDISSAGYAFRAFAASYLKAHGKPPEWDPYIFGGMPLAAGHGDVLYPTALLRLILPVDVGITLGFMIHIALAGFFTFLFLRALKLDWGPAFLGGLAYMLGGQVISLVSPGHDGKLFVSALLPLALMFLYQGVTTGAWRRYICFGAVVGFSLLTPHNQMTYYLLMAAGFFWMFLVFLSGERPAGHKPVSSFALFVVALAVGFALAAAQLAPFMEYIKFSPRGASGGSTGWAYATAWSMPPEELLNVIWPRFSGILRDYWGRNPFKLHSEYIGAAVLMLATLGFQLEGRRRLAWFFVFLSVYGSLFAFGGHTPFYYLPYYLLPGIKLTRAVGMIFFLASFSAAVLAAFGLQAIITRGTELNRRPLYWWVGVIAIAAIFALVGAWRPIMEAMAQPERFGAIAANYPAFRLDSLRVLAVATAILAVVWKAPSIRSALIATGLIIGLDLVSIERHFVQWEPPAPVTAAADPIVQRLKADPEIFRVLPFQVHGPYDATYLMVHELRSVLGYSGNELQRYDELMGGKNIWRNESNPNLWKLLAVKYIVLPDSVNYPGLVLELGPVMAVGDQPLFLYRVTDAAPFAYLVKEAVKVPDEQIVPTLMDPRFDPRRLLLVPTDASAGVTSLGAVPDSLPGRVTTTAIRAGEYQFAIESPPSAPAYLFVAENYYPDWHAEVDGKAVALLRAQHSLMALPLPTGSRQVHLFYVSTWDRPGQAISATVLVLLLLLAGVSAVQGRARRDA